MSSEWVKCSERLPEVGQIVRAKMPIIHGGYTAYVKFEGDCWHEVGRSFADPINYVSEWQPLPDPPAGEEG